MIVAFGQTTSDTGTILYSYNKTIGFGSSIDLFCCLYSSSPAGIFFTRKLEIAENAIEYLANSTPLCNQRTGVCTCKFEPKNRGFCNASLSPDNENMFFNTEILSQDRIGIFVCDVLLTGGTFLRKTIEVQSGNIS